MIAAATLVRIIGESYAITSVFGTVVIKVYKSSAWAFINWGRAFSRTMWLSLKIFNMEKEAASFDVFAQHVRTEQILVADRISLGRFSEA